MHREFKETFPYVGLKWKAALKAVKDNGEGYLITPTESNEELQLNDALTAETQQ